jgi:hypothetical protein
MTTTVASQAPCSELQKRGQGYVSNHLAVRYRVTGACVMPNPAFVPLKYHPANVSAPNKHSATTPFILSSY